MRLVDSKINCDICIKMCHQLNTPRIFLNKFFKTCNWNYVGLVERKSGRLWYLCEAVKDRDIFYVYVTDGNTATAVFWHIQT